MKLEEYEHILRTGTPSDRARAIAAASNDKELSEEEFHRLTALIKGAVRPSARKMTPDEAKLWAEVSRVNTRLKQGHAVGPARNSQREMLFAVQQLFPGAEAAHRL